MSVAVLTIAGLDPTGGAGVIADCRILARNGVEPLAVVSALTVQNRREVFRVVPVESDMVLEQISRLTEELPIAAVKIGLLPGRDLIESVARLLPEKIPLVLDPVFSSSSGFRFQDERGIDAMKEFLLPKVKVVAPNRVEAEILSGRKIRDAEDWARAAGSIRELGAGAVLITGGDEEGPEAVDRLYDDGGFEEYRLPRFHGVSVHGTGCALTAAIAAAIAKGDPLRDAVRVAKKDVHRRIENARKSGNGSAILDFTV